MKDERDEDERALRSRDGRFVIRLLLLLAIAGLAGVWVGARLTQDEVGGCAARGFQDVTGGVESNM